MRDRFRTCIRNRAFKVGNVRAYKILRRAHLQIGEMQVAGVRVWRAGCRTRPASAKEPHDGNHDDDEAHAKTYCGPINSALLRLRRTERRSHRKLPVLYKKTQKDTG